jgi:hypothetical protein
LLILLADNSFSSNDSGYLSTFINSILYQQTFSNTSYSLINNYNSKSNQHEDKENQILDTKQDSKKLRTTFTETQKQMLDEYFAMNPYPDPKETEDLSNQLSLAENVIKVWFQNKRSRNKQRKSTNSKRIYAVQESLVNNLKIFSEKFNS